MIPEWCARDLKLRSDTLRIPFMFIDARSPAVVGGGGPIFFLLASRGVDSYICIRCYMYKNRKRGHRAGGSDDAV